MSSKKDLPTVEIPEILIDKTTGKRYNRGRFLGKGGFAKCFEITDMDTKAIWAGKIVPKVLFFAIFIILIFPLVKMHSIFCWLMFSL